MWECIGIDQYEQPSGLPVLSLGMFNTVPVRKGFRGLNELMPEPRITRISLKAAPSSHVAVHVDRCQCTPTFNDTKVLGRFKDKSSREVAEAFHISERGKDCASSPSIAIHTVAN